MAQKITVLGNIAPYKFLVLHMQKLISFQWNYVKYKIVSIDDLYNSLRAEYYFNLSKFQEYKQEIHLQLIHVVV